jgi:predicted MFS family arabinose efflux permease
MGIVGLGVFIYRQLHLEKPFLDIRILNVKEYRIALIASMLLYLAMMAATILIPIYVQTIREYSATISGLVMMPASIAMAIISPMAGRIYDKLGIKKLFIGGSVLQLVSYAGMAVLSFNTSMVYLAVVLVIRNLAIGCLMMPLVTWGMSSVEKKKTSDGTALFTSLRTVAGAIGSALFAGVMTVVESHASSIVGIDVAFICLTVVALIQLFIAIFCCKGAKEIEAVKVVVS